VKSLFASSMGAAEWEQREAFFGDGAREWRGHEEPPRQIEGFVHYPRRRRALAFG
jgi:hypothetical protein